MSATLYKPAFQEIDIALIDEPDNAMRTRFDQHAMEDLADSIRDNGLIQPIAVVRSGGRYRVAAGHRRSIACVLAGLATVPAMVYPENTPLEEVIKNHENSRREKVNAADEAQYFKRLLDEKCGGDVNRLAGIVGERLSYVEGRLDLLRGYPEVFEALQEGHISITAAIELNRYKDHGFMLSHLRAAIQTGARATQISRWRTDLEKMFEQCPQPDVQPGSAAPLPSSQAPTMSCVVCGESHDPYNLEFIYIHRGGPCRKILDRALGAIGSGGQ